MVRLFHVFKDFLDFVRSVVFAEFVIMYNALFLQQGKPSLQGVFAYTQIVGYLGEVTAFLTKFSILGVQHYEKRFLSLPIKVRL